MTEDSWAAAEGLASGGAVKTGPIDDDSKWFIPGYSSYEYVPQKCITGAYEKEWNPRPDQCPHCLRDRHNGPLTENVAWMYANHTFRADYDPAEDVSEIVCVGSDVFGPPRPPKSRAPSGSYHYVLGDDSQWTFPAPTYSYTTTLPQQMQSQIWKGLEWPKWELPEPFVLSSWFVQDEPASTEVAIWEPNPALPQADEIEWDWKQFTKTCQADPDAAQQLLNQLQTMWHNLVELLGVIEAPESSADYQPLIDQANKPFQKALPKGK